MGKNAALFGGNWNNTSNSGSRASNWNNSPTNSNDNISCRGVSEGEQPGFSVLYRRYGPAGRPVCLWSAVLSCFGKHPWGSGIASSSLTATGAAGFIHA
jgi:hypothetical protein